MYEIRIWLITERNWRWAEQQKLVGVIPNSTISNSDICAAVHMAVWIHYWIIDRGCWGVPIGVDFPLLEIFEGK